jgi:leucyl aminopeptidase
MTKYALSIDFTDGLYDAQDTIVLMTVEGQGLSAEGEKLDDRTSGSVAKALHGGNFSGKAKEVCVVSYPAGIGAARIILFGLGKLEDLCRRECREIGGELYAKLAEHKAVHAYVLFPECEKKETMIDNIAFGAELRAYAFDDYKTVADKKEKDDKKHTPRRIDFYAAGNHRHETYKRLSAVRQGTYFARDVVTMPPNKLTPLAYADIVKETLSHAGVKVHILPRKKLEKLGMGALLGVAQGSENEGCVVVMEWNGNPASKECRIALVGKGVTFDTGGISIKPAQGMEDMKYDMGGSAAAAGTVYALALRKAAVNAVGVIGLVENMPDGAAQRPSDVVTSLSGQTVEVLNTDAEGRLVLADILTYVQREYAPECVVNLATLTGAIVIALGSEYAGLFSNNDALAERLYQAGLDTGEKLWRFPLHKNYDKLIDCDIADMQNISGGRGAGSITAAQFLQRFIDAKTAWAHLDIAGTAWTKEPLSTVPKGATGFGVQLLDHLIAEHYEA